MKILKLQNGSVLTEQQKLDNEKFFSDYAQRYNKIHNTDKTDVIMSTLKEDVPELGSDKGNAYSPKKDKITLLGYHPSTYSHEMSHKLNDSVPTPRLERSEEEAQLLRDAYPLGKLQNSRRWYRKYAGDTEHFATNTELRRSISDKNNNATGEELDNIIKTMDSEKLGRMAGSNGYGSRRDYFNYPEHVNSPKTFYEEMGGTNWESLPKKERKQWKWEYDAKTGIDKIGIIDEEKVNKVREALIKVAGINNKFDETYS